jgi:hypothetical protein
MPLKNRDPTMLSSRYAAKYKNAIGLNCIPVGVKI